PTTAGRGGSARFIAPAMTANRPVPRAGPSCPPSTARDWTRPLSWSRAGTAASSWVRAGWSVPTGAARPNACAPHRNASWSSTWTWSCPTLSHIPARCTPPWRNTGQRSGPRSSPPTAWYCSSGCRPKPWMPCAAGCAMPPATKSGSPVCPSLRMADNSRMTDASPLPEAAIEPKSKAPIGSLKMLWPFVRRHRGLFAAWLAALVASSTATLTLPHAFRIMIDQGFSQGGGTAIDRAFMLLFAVAVALALATAVRFFFVSLLGERVVADLRGQLYAHLVSLDAGFFDRTRSGELVSRLTADAELLRGVIATSMSVALRS